MNHEERILLGEFTEQGIDALLGQAAALNSTGERITRISSEFLGVPYKKNTLVGSPDTPEVLVMDLGGVDCLTFLEYVEAMRRSGSFREFKKRLKEVRYYRGVVSYTCRHHFFTDWIPAHAARLREVSLLVGQTRACLATKRLNRRESGEAYVPGIPSVERYFHYIPGKRLDKAVMKNLRAGDYIGIYAEEDGLDVSHTGIVIVTEGRCLIRHASSSPSRMKVIDEDLLEYASSRPGIIVFRARR